MSRGSTTYAPPRTRLLVVGGSWIGVASSAESLHASLRLSGALLGGPMPPGGPRQGAD
ncbi:hypothetical protein V8D89_004039 [Ganoderma adspersum]